MRVLLLSLLLLLGPCRAFDALLPPAQLGPPSLGFSSSVRSVCKPIPSSLSLCRGVGYRSMWLPNLLGHDSLREVQQQSAPWLPLVSKRCHRDTQKFLCALFAPVCLPELRGPLSPCRSLCEAVRHGCVPVMSAFGFPWPDMLHCSRFPSASELCIPESGQREEEEALKGSVICDACLTAEGETDIQDDFCHSPYALKMRLGSMSTVGGDRQLVPLARSRILRWAGGGAENVEHYGGTVTHKALWLQEGDSCTCPGLDSLDVNKSTEIEEVKVDKRPVKEGGKVRNRIYSGWFLALARAEEGRLVLTRLVRWTRGDKELKMFLRVLLKQTCPDI